MGLITESTSGGAYAILARPRNFNGGVNRLTNTLNGSFEFSAGPGTGGKYNSVSPDSFLVAALFDPLNGADIEPPNALRKAMWELKFDTVLNWLGTFEIYTGIVYASTLFTTTYPRDLPVNVAKSVVTVVPKGDLNLDGSVSPADVVLELMCVYLGDIPPAGQSACDLNCDGQVTAADVAVMLNFKYLTGVWPC